MIRWLKVWRLRRAQARLQAEIHWLRDAIWTGQVRLSALEVKERNIQAEIWCAEAPSTLLSGRRSGLTSRRRS